MMHMHSHCLLNLLSSDAAVAVIVFLNSLIGISWNEACNYITSFIAAEQSNNDCSSLAVVYKLHFDGKVSYFSVQFHIQRNDILNLIGPAFSSLCQWSSILLA